jgi:7-cyano-7-deazaguanine synthase in queuosine biosynthesis
MISLLAAYEHLAEGGACRVPAPIYRVAKESLSGVPEAQATGVLLQSIQAQAYAVCVSGGLDSFVAYRLACARCPSAWGVHLRLDTDYEWKEVDAVRKQVPKDRLIEVDLRRFDLERLNSWAHIIPLRNAVAVSAAAEYSYGTVWLAALEGEMRGDKSARFFEEASKATGLEVGTPFADKTKADVIAWALSEQLATAQELLDQTVTCFGYTQGHCGKCRACLRRWIAFTIAGGVSAAELADTFDQYPPDAAKREANRYRKEMKRAVRTGDFATYSERRCRQTLQALDAA